MSLPHAAPAITDLMGGQVDGFFDDISGVIAFIQSGNLRPIGIGATKRHPLLPDVKTFEEMGIKGIELNNWSAIYVAKTVPEAQVNELSRAIRKVVENPAVKDKLRASGVELQASSSAELNTLVQADLARWRQVILAHGIKAE